MYLPPLSSVRVFEAAARHLSFHRAALELNITPSAVSHQIRALETFLGVRLFHRTGRQVSLTAAGLAYLPPLQEAIYQIRRATEQIQRHHTSGPLTVSAAPAFATQWLVHQLPTFQARYPDLEVRLIVSTEPPDFDHSQIDLAIRFGHGQWPHWCCYWLMAEELVPLVSPLYDGLAGLRRPEDLRHAHLLHVIPRSGDWKTWLQAAQVTGVDTESGSRFQSVPLALDAASSGLGVAIADRRMAAHYLASGRLQVLFDVKLDTGNAYYVVYPKERAENQKIALFRDWLLAEVTPAG